MKNRTFDHWVHNGRGEDLWDVIAMRCGFDNEGLELQNMIKQFVEEARKIDIADFAESVKLEKQTSNYPEFYLAGMKGYNQALTDQEAKIAEELTKRGAL